jgi:hypothetical protein
VEETIEYHLDGLPLASPLRHNEVVEIRPIDLDTEPEVVELIGKRGVVSGWAYDENGGWSYAIAIQSGDCWCFDAAELKSLRIILTQAELYGPRPEKQEWARINSDGECVAGDPSFLRRGPTPLFVDLEQLVLKG